MPTLDSIVKAFGLVDDIYANRTIMLARHASQSMAILNRSLEFFEEYQRFQTDQNFRQPKFIISFAGIPNRNGRASFVGIYKVLGVLSRGDHSFREPEGDPEVIKLCAGQKYLYSLERLRLYDDLIAQWEIEWDTPAPAKYRFMKPNLEISVSKFPVIKDADVLPFLKSFSLARSIEFEIDTELECFSEGTPYYRKHLHRERNAQLVATVKAEAKAQDKYFCFVCGFDFL